MSKTKCFWTMKNGQQIDVDKMDENHLRNALKMMIRQKRNQVKLNDRVGNIEDNFLDECINELNNDLNDLDDLYLYGI